MSQSLCPDFPNGIFPLHYRIAVFRALRVMVRIDRAFNQTQLAGILNEGSAYHFSLMERICITYVRSIKFEPKLLPLTRKPIAFRTAAFFV